MFALQKLAKYKKLLFTDLNKNNTTLLSNTDAPADGLAITGTKYLNVNIFKNTLDPKVNLP